MGMITQARLIGAKVLHLLLEFSIAGCSTGIKIQQ